MSSADRVDRKKRKRAEHELKRNFLRCGDKRRLDYDMSLFRSGCKYSCCSQEGAAAIRVLREQHTSVAAEPPPTVPTSSSTTTPAYTFDISNEPVAELKRLCALRGIDTSGCLEKREIVMLLRPSDDLSASPSQPSNAHSAAPPAAARPASKQSSWAHARRRSAVAHGLTLAEKYDPAIDTDLRGFVAMEKYDGIRASWEGCSFRTRSGGHLRPPPSLAALLPTDVRLDGELWVGRGKFEQTLSLVRTPDEAKWARVQYVVFDAPAAQGGFEERLRRARVLLAAALPTRRVAVAPAWPCETAAALDTLHERVVAKGGEGLILRRGSAPFSFSLSARDLLKVKEWHDAEAIVLSSNRPRGKESVHVRSLTGDVPGVEFDLGCADCSRLPPRTLVTYKFMRGLANGMPRFPILTRVHEEGCDCAPCQHWRAQRGN